MQEPPQPPATTGDNRTPTELERHAWQREIETLRAELAKAQEITVERDALAKQKAHLAQQLAELTRKSGFKVSFAESSANGGGPPQRKLDELQRRIAALEHGQRDTALELQREREAKIKLERQLASADRLRQDAAIHYEESHATLRREFETSVRKREAESARALKEAQEQIETINAAKARLITELEEARSRLSDQSAPPERTVDAAFEERVIAQFEADIASYRSRIKTLLQERDDLTVEKEKLSATLISREQELAEQVPASNVPSPAQKIDEDVQHQFTALRDQVTALKRERDEARTAVESLSAKSGSEAASDQSAKLVRERDLALEEGEKLLAEIDAIQAEQQRAANRFEGDLAALEKDHNERIAALQQQMDEQRTERAKVAEELVALRVAHAELACPPHPATSEHENQRFDPLQALVAPPPNFATHDNELRFSQRQRDEALTRLESEREQRDQNAAELARAKAALINCEAEIASRFERELTRTQRERDAIAHERDALNTRLEQLVEERHMLLEGAISTAGVTEEHLAAEPGKAGHERKSRRGKEAKIIDINAAEVLTAQEASDQALKIPRIQPVAVLPPQLRTL